MLNLNRHVSAARIGLSLALSASIALLPRGAQAQVVYETSPPPAPITTAPAAPAAPASPRYEGPRIINYEDGDPIPPGYYVVEQLKTGMIVGGAVLFGTLYVISLLVAAGNTDATAHGQTSPTDALYIPLIGPFVQMTRSNSTATGNVFLAIDGLGQAGGMALLIGGIMTTRSVLARSSTSSNEGHSPSSSASLKWTATPLVGPGMSGIGVVGTF